MKRWIAMIILAAGAGCYSKLETGYVPRKLGSSEEVRRGYYAEPFTAEAAAAKRYDDDFNGGGQKTGR